MIMSQCPKEASAITTDCTQVLPVSEHEFLLGNGPCVGQIDFASTAALCFYCQFFLMFNRPFCPLFFPFFFILYAQKSISRLRTFFTPRMMFVVSKTIHTKGINRLHFFAFQTHFLLRNFRDMIAPILIIFMPTITTP